MSNLQIDENGNKRWYANGKLHREDGPAVERANGDKEWWVEGKLHRLDGPAREYTLVLRGELKVEHWWCVKGKRLSSPFELLKYGAKLEDIAQYLTAREIAKTLDKQ